MKTKVHFGSWCEERLRDFKTEGLVVLGDHTVESDLTCADRIALHCGERFADGHGYSMYEGGDSGYKYVYHQWDGVYAENYLRFMNAMHVKSVTVLNAGAYAESVFDHLVAPATANLLTTFSDIYVVNLLSDWQPSPEMLEFAKQNLKETSLYFGEYGFLVTPPQVKIGYRLISSDELEIGFVRPSEHSPSIEELEIPDGTQIPGLDGGYRVVGIASDAFESDSPQGQRRWTDDVKVVTIPRCLRSLDITMMLKTFREIEEFQVDPLNPFFVGEGVLLRKRT